MRSLNSLTFAALFQLPLIKKLSGISVDQRCVLCVRRADRDGNHIVRTLKAKFCFGNCGWVTSYRCGPIDLRFADKKTLVDPPQNEWRVQLQNAFAVAYSIELIRRNSITVFPIADCDRSQYQPALPAELRRSPRIAPGSTFRVDSSPDNQGAVRPKFERFPVQNFRINSI